MPSPAPTYADRLVLVTQKLTAPTVSHQAQVTYALLDAGNVGPQSCADQFQTAFNDSFGASFAIGVTVEKPEVLEGDGTEVPGVAIAGGSAVTGTADIDLPSPQVCVLLKKITSFGGKENRGRTYLPFACGEASIDPDGSLIGDVLTDLQDAAAALLEALITADIPMVICNRAVSANPTPPPATYVSAYGLGNAVTQYLLEGKVATQRRRLVRT